MRAAGADALPSRRSPSLHWVKILFASLGRARTFGLAGEMAFWLFLSILPLAAVAGLVVARFAMRETELTTAMLATVPPAARDLITGELGRVSAWNGGAVAPLAAITFVWLASSGIHAIFDGLELETESEPRPWWKKRLYAIVACVGLSIGFASIALLATGVAWIRGLLGDLDAFAYVPRGAALVLRAIAGWTIAVMLVAGVYWIGLPPPARRRMPILPGAILAVVLQGILGLGYGAWVRNMGDSGAYQAGLAVIGVTLMALYLASTALLVGVELNQLLGARRILLASVHPAVVPPPPVTDGMVRCEPEPTSWLRRLRRYGRASRSSAPRAGTRPAERRSRTNHFERSTT